MTEFVEHVQRLAKPVTSRLGFLDIELTERCNNDCIHCCINRPANDAEARRREMSTDQIKAVLTEAAGLGCLKVRFTGGEPLLRPDFEELYLHARRSGITVLIFTNGCLLTPRMADLLARIPPRQPVEVTVYGMHKESYEAVTRAPGSFAQFRRGVQLLLERKVPFIVKSALLPPNWSEVEKFEAWAATIPWMTAPPHYFLFFDLRYRRDDPGKNARIKSLRMSPAEGLAVIRRDAKRNRVVMHEFASKFMGPPGDRLFPCGAGRGLSIDPYGQARPCMGVYAPALTHDLIPALSSRNALADALASFQPLRALRASNPDYLQRCAVCFLKGLCEQCPGKSWAEHGNLDTPVEYLCEVAHAQARWLRWLDADEMGWTITNWRERVIGRNAGETAGTGV